MAIDLLVSTADCRAVPRGYNMVDQLIKEATSSTGNHSNKDQ
jgi:hypothetical protein